MLYFYHPVYNDRKMSNSVIPIYIYIYIYVRMYVNIRTHTHTHIPLQKRSKTQLVERRETL